MPEPKANESKNAFISRFMSNEQMQKEYPDRDQRVAIAYTKWRSEKE